NVSGARMALAATAGPLVQHSALAVAAGELARRTPLGRPGERLGAVPPAAAWGGGDPAPPATPAAPAAPAAAPGQPPAPGPAPLPERRYVASASDFEPLREPFDFRRLVLPLGALAALLLLAGAGWLAVGALRGQPTS